MVDTEAIISTYIKPNYSLDPPCKITHRSPPNCHNYHQEELSLNNTIEEIIGEDQSRLSVSNYKIDKINIVGKEDTIYNSSKAPPVTPNNDQNTISPISNTTLLSSSY